MATYHNTRLARTGNLFDNWKSGILLLCFCLMMGAGKLSAQMFCDSITSPTTNDEDFSILQAADGNYYMAWWNDSTGSPDLWIQRSTDFGFTWDSSWIAISNPDNNWYPQLGQTSDGTFHLVWFRNFISNGTHDVHYSSSTDLFNWSTPENLTDSSSVDWVPHLLVDQNDVLWISWASSRTGQLDLFSIHSNDTGATWSAPAQLTNHPENDGMPYVAQHPNGTYYMTWQRYNTPIFQYITDSSDIWFATSQDGLTWSAPDSLTYDTATRHVEVLPAIYIQENTGEVNFLWTGARYNPFGSIMSFPLSEYQTGSLGDQATEISCGGYFGRMVPADTNMLDHVFFISDRDGDMNRDISHTLSFIVGVEDEVNDPIECKLYPNPGNQWLRVETSSQSNLRALDLINGTGQRVLSLQNLSGTEMELKTADLPQGIYFLHILLEGNQTLTRKVLILH